MNAQLPVTRRARPSFGLLPLTLLALLSACDQSREVTAPSEVDPQYAPPPSQTTVRFVVTAGPGGAPIQNAIVSVYLNETATPTRLHTDMSGVAEILLDPGTKIGYLGRAHAQVDFSQLAPQPDFFLAARSPYNNLDALTCGTSGAPTVFTGQALVDCVKYRYLTVDKVAKSPQIITLALPLVGFRDITLKGLSGEDLDAGEAEAYLIEQVPQFFAWHGTRPVGVVPGFLRFVDGGATTLQLPNKAGNVEAKGKAPNGVTIAASVPTSQLTNGEVYLSPQVCVNPAENIPYTVTRTGPFNPEFSFQKFWWAYAATDADGITKALQKDLTTVAIAIEFAQSGGPITLDLNVRQRTAGGTQTASVAVSCTNGDCAIQNAVYNVPGAGNLMNPQLTQPKTGKLFLIVQSLDPTADIEWAAQALKPGQGNKMTVIDQIPDPSKAESSSAFVAVSRNTLLCHPDYSFDKSFDINW